VTKQSEFDPYDTQEFPDEVPISECRVAVFVLGLLSAAAFAATYAALWLWRAL
jgi:hypothetical protein